MDFIVPRFVFFIEDGGKGDAAAAAEARRHRHFVMHKGPNQIRTLIDARSSAPAALVVGEEGFSL